MVMVAESVGVPGAAGVVVMTALPAGVVMVACPGVPFKSAFLLILISPIGVEIVASLPRIPAPPIMLPIEGVKARLTKLNSTPPMMLAIMSTTM